ncbi:MAG: hypothetical protein J6B02_02650 [Selenomonadales bacterium]|nr:hypothetical protein [Selenomonadales bacterium]
MMTRLLLMICLMMTMLMPCAWAEENVVPPFEVPQEFAEAWQHVQNGTEVTYSMPQKPEHDPDIYYYKKMPLKIGSPLSYLTIKTEDQIEGNTYYIRYTITNSTDEMIEKDIDYIDIGCRLFTSQDKHLLYQNYHSDDIRTLMIPPRSSRSFTIPLTIKTPFKFIRYASSRFFFTDNTHLVHEAHNSTILPKVLMTPIVLPSGEVYLAMKNHHPTKTITDIRDPVLRIYFREKDSDSFVPTTHFNYIDTARLPLQLKPQETVFFRLPRSFDEMNDKLTLSFSELDIIIDDTRHSFESSLSKYDIYKADTFDNRSVRYDSPSIFNKYGLNIVEASGTYETDDTTLYGYLRIKNPHNATIYFTIPSLSSLFTYYKADNTRSKYEYLITFPYALSLDPQEETSLSFSLPLPQDIDHTFRFMTRILSAENTKGRNILYHKVLFTKENTPFLQKIHSLPAIEPYLSDWPD